MNATANASIIDKPDCPHCADAKSGDQRWIGTLDATCSGCQARRIAKSPAAWKAVNGQTGTEVRDEILRTFGPDRMKAARESVWQWIQRLGIAPKT